MQTKSYRVSFVKSRECDNILTMSKSEFDIRIINETVIELVPKNNHPPTRDHGMDWKELRKDALENPLQFMAIIGVAGLLFASEEIEAVEKKARSFIAGIRQRVFKS